MMVYIYKWLNNSFNYQRIGIKMLDCIILGENSHISIKGLDVC